MHKTYVSIQQHGRRWSTAGAGVTDPWSGATAGAIPVAGAGQGPRGRGCRGGSFREEGGIGEGGAGAVGEKSNCLPGAQAERRFSENRPARWFAASVGIGGP